jgi:hypothetical protein
MNAINDALRPLGAKPLTDMPFTPGKILAALGEGVSSSYPSPACGGGISAA